MSLLGRMIRPRADIGSAYAGARFNRLTMDWIFSHLSVDQEIRGSMMALRGRSRDLVKNVPWARKYVRHMANNVVGPHGIALRGKIPKKLSRDSKLNERLNTRLETRWREWCKKQNCTVDGKLSWLDVQRLSLKTVPTDGEVFLRRIRGFDNPFGFAVQLIDPDLLDHEYNRTRTDHENEIRLGIEVNKYGKPLAYWFWENHPSEPNGRVRKRIPADQITHLYDPERVAQTRGVTWFVAVMLQLHMLHGYSEAHLVASRVASAKSGFFVRKEPDSAADYDPENQEDLVMEAEPGVFEELPPGVEFQAWDPTHPNTAYAEYVKSMLQAIGSGLSTSYVSLANDLEGVNFSSIRAGLLDERDEWRSRQQWAIEHEVDDVYSDWVDPLKDGQSAEKEIELGINSRTRIAAAKGRHLPDVLDELQNEQELAQQRGLDIDPKSSGADDQVDDEDEDDPESRGGKSGGGVNITQSMDGRDRVRRLETA